MMPLHDARAQGKRYPVSHPPRWQARMDAEQAAAEQLSAASLDGFPPEVAEAYIALLYEQASAAQTMLQLTETLKQIYSQQDQIQERSDTLSETLRDRCGEVDGGCVFSPERPDDPGQSVEALQAFVAAARDVHIQDEAAEASWVGLLDVLDERVAVLQQEMALTRQFEEQKMVISEMEEREQSLYRQLTADCAQTQPPTQSAPPSP